MTDQAWTKERIESFLAENRFAYQNVELPHGLKTGGEDRSETANRIFPADLTGKSVLDIGCMYGYFCFEAEKRGASRIVGVEINPENAEKCRMLADIKGSPCEFWNSDIEQDAIDEKFDYILCLNVLHHLRNPISVLDYLISITNEKLILEIAAFSHKDRKKSRVPSLFAPVLNRLPIIYLGDAGVEGSRPETASQTFFITRKAIETMLIGQRRSIAKIAFHDEGHKERYTVVAHKRRIEHLVIVAGVPTSGKSSLIQRLLAAEADELGQKIGLDRSQSWDVWRYAKIPPSEPAVARNVLMHCNISQHLLDGDNVRYGNALLDLIKVADRVSVVTLWCSPGELARRYESERAGIVSNRNTLRRRKKKDRLFSRLFASERSTEALFAGWFDFVKRHVGHSEIVLQDEDNRIVDIAEWEARHWPQRQA